MEQEGLGFFLKFKGVLSGLLAGRLPPSIL